jgi:hypothetical protein
MVEGVAERVRAVATDSTRSPVERLLAFGAGISKVGDEPKQVSRPLLEIQRPAYKTARVRIRVFMASARSNPVGRVTSSLTNVGGAVSDARSGPTLRSW